MTVVLVAEGATELALERALKAFLDERATAEGRPKVALRTKPTMSLNANRLRRDVELELSSPRVTAVVGLIDVYPEFSSASEAKEWQRQAVGAERRFYPHAAQYDVEAWLLPYWDVICGRLSVRRTRPGPQPEQVDRDKPPSKHLEALYAAAHPPRKYVKRIEMLTILRRQNLTVAADQCPELKALLNTLLALGGLSTLP